MCVCVCVCVCICVCVCVCVHFLVQILRGKQFTACGCVVIIPSCNTFTAWNFTSLASIATVQTNWHVHVCNFNIDNNG